MITIEWVVINLIVMFAAFIMGISGFGFVLVTTPLLLLLVDPKMVIVFNVTLGVLVCIPPLWQTYRHLQPSRIIVLVVSSILGLPLGIYILSRLSSLTLKAVIITIVVFFTILLASGVSFKIKRERLGLTISGFISGALSNSAGLGGPPIILFLLNQGWSQEAFRANIAAYFILNGIAAALSLFISGNLANDALIYALTTIPALAAGYFAATLLLPRINARLFRIIAIYVLLGCSLLSIIDALNTFVF